MRTRREFIGIRILFAWLFAAVAVSAQEPAVAKVIDISKVVSEFPVGFCLLSSPELQYVAYYDANRNMVVASRKLDAESWVYQVLPTKIGWDSHNYVTMALDSAGQLHVSGNMHKKPLIYFRTTKAGDITTLKDSKMVGLLEDKVTYPRFFKDKQNRLIFSYRDGSSGSGDNFYNVYDAQTQTWSRLLETPLFEGEKKRNAYASEPFLGPDGMFHVHWVWRESSDCSTNHHLSYVRSPDLLNWESVSGEKVKLPIKLEHKNLYVDPIPIGGGIINGGHRLVFDSQNKPILVYHKSDANGNMQIYAARADQGRWEIQVLTKWEKPMKFSGGGTMAFFGIALGNVAVVGPDVVRVHFKHKDYGSGSLQFNAKTLQVIEGPVPKLSDLPSNLGKVESSFPGMGIKRATDLGSSGEKGVRYILQWETLEANNDKPRQPPLPQPSQLRLYKIKTE